MTHCISLISRALSSAFYIGFIPGAPGTYASLATVVALHLADRFVFGGALDTGAVFLLATGAVTVVGVGTATVASKAAGEEDPSFVVIDEVAGQLLTFSLVPLGGGAGIANLALGLVAFRLFDIWKPWPIRRLEALPGGVGIMADDLLAGAYGCVALHLAGALFRFTGLDLQGWV
ncbi:MAG: phosphatidylglycerophosphatase A [Acidobacteriota bacterium]|jgi:phosphatidylglycerophosphatase A|nr:phosphatidylglycerophosphatase A [Acidobacteriota bacterium]